MEYKIGDIVVKAKRYSNEDYCLHGGDETEVPIGSKGIIYRIEGKNRIYVEFEKGDKWGLDSSELKLCKKCKSQDLVRYMAFGTGCNNRGDVRNSEKELKADMSRFLKDREWSRRIIGYKLVPLFEGESKVVFKVFKKAVIKKRGVGRPKGS